MELAKLIPSRKADLTLGSLNKSRSLGIHRYICDLSAGLNGFDRFLRQSQLGRQLIF